MNETAASFVNGKPLLIHDPFRQRLMANLPNDALPAHVATKQN